MVYPHKWSPVIYRSSAGQGNSPAKDRRYTSVPRNQRFSMTRWTWLPKMEIVKLQCIAVFV